jgi:TatD DNase family protein
MLIDSHFHPQILQESLSDDQLAQLLHRAQQAQVHILLAVAVSLADVNYLQRLAQTYPQIYYSVGIHPLYIDQGCLPPAFVLPDDPKCVAIGEIGLDYGDDCSAEFQQVQQAVFRMQLQLAYQQHKPVIIHNRHAGHDILKILAEFPGIKGVLHCFNDSLEIAQRAIDMGLYLSFAGIITFANKSLDPLREVIQQIPLERILVETDAPYLTPVPWRGHYPNEPQYLTAIAQKICSLKNISLTQGAAAFTQNTMTLFNFQYDD